LTDSCCGFDTKLALAGKFGVAKPYTLTLPKWPEYGLRFHPEMTREGFRGQPCSNNRDWNTAMDIQQFAAKYGLAIKCEKNLGDERTVRIPANNGYLEDFHGNALRLSVEEAVPV